MTSAQTQLAQRRLWLGITNVGFWVLVAGGGLIWLANGDASALSIRLVAGIGCVAVAVQAVFDFFGGAVLMPQPRPALADFVRRWFRGALGHTLVLAGVGLLSYGSFRFTGGFLVAVLLATAALALGRSPLASAIGGAAIRAAACDGRAVLTFQTTDSAFTGGIVGFGRRAKSLLPASWLDGLPKEEIVAESRRRQWQMADGLPVRSVALIGSWNLLGAFLGSLAFPFFQRSPGEAVLGHACWMTLWAFGGLLVLPVLSRRAVFAADRAAAASGLDPSGWITRFARVIGEDGSSNPAAQAVFYPIPSVAMRLRQLDRPSSGFVPGNLARNNLYYSWATLTLLGRAVHCNVGRPALWVFPPMA